LKYFCVMRQVKIMRNPYNPQSHVAHNYAR